MALVKGHTDRGKPCAFLGAFTGYFYNTETVIEIGSHKLEMFT